MARHVHRGDRTDRRPRLFEKDDYCQYASVDISQHKARAAARYRRPTLVFERLLAKGGFFAYLPTLGDAFIA